VSFFLLDGRRVAAFDAAAGRVYRIPRKAAGGVLVYRWQNGDMVKEGMLPAILDR
jgi:hypothetical protein